MVHLTLDEWRAEAVSRFGSDPLKWAFRCPACGHVATVADHVALGKSMQTAYQECIGRSNGTMKPPSDNTAEGCNWAAYGLFGTAGKGRVVLIPEGKNVEVFDFAEAPAREEGG